MTCSRSEPTQPPIAASATADDPRVETLSVGSGNAGPVTGHQLPRRYLA
jgi:hypothetical protein